MAFSFGRGLVHTASKGKDQRENNYGGVLASSGDYRLIVTLKGARFCLQHRAYPGGPHRSAVWSVVSWALTLPVLVARFPDGLSFDGLSGIPENPADVPRW